MRLAALVGRWRTQGWTIEAADAPAARIEAVDTYEWPPGGFALLHRIDARVGDEHVEGTEIIGWDSALGFYVTQYFGSDGPNAYEASLTDEGGALVWRMRSGSHRFTGRLSDAGQTIEGRWERLEATGLGVLDEDHADAGGPLMVVAARCGPSAPPQGRSRPRAEARSLPAPCHVEPVPDDSLVAGSRLGP